MLTQARHGPTTEPRGFLSTPVLTRSALMQRAGAKLSVAMAATDAKRRQLAAAVYG